MEGRAHRPTTTVTARWESCVNWPDTADDRFKRKQSDRTGNIDPPYIVCVCECGCHVCDADWCQP